MKGLENENVCTDMSPYRRESTKRLQVTMGDRQSKVLDDD